MIRTFFLFLGIFGALAVSWASLVMAPYFQIGMHQPQETQFGGRYPVQMPGQANRGQEVYRANGCYACHTQQVRQEGVAYEVYLTEAGSAQDQLIQKLLDMRPDWDQAMARDHIRNLPVLITTTEERSSAETIQRQLEALGAEDVAVRISFIPTGSDIARGWGGRRSVAADFLYKQPVMLGWQRMGPDLANVGARQMQATWHYQHLYDPQYVSPSGSSSVMPPYRYLFELKEKTLKPNPDALRFPASYEGIPEGYDVVPTDEAKALVSYLINTKAVEGIYEAPLPRPPQPAREQQEEDEAAPDSNAGGGSADQNSSGPTAPASPN